MKRVVTYLCGAAATVALLILATIADGFTRRFAGSWQPDDGSAQGYFLLLTPDSIVTTAGPGHPLRVITPDTLAAHTGECLTDMPVFESRAPLFNAAWEYSWARMSQCRPTAFNIYMTAMVAPHFFSPDDVMSPTQDCPPPAAPWPLGDAAVPARVIAACEYALAQGSEALSRMIAARCRELLAVERERLGSHGSELWRGGGDGQLSGSLPDWLDEGDRFNTVSSALNALAATAYAALATLENSIGESSAEASSRAEAMAAEMAARLWLPTKGCFSQYLYGRLSPVKSPSVTGAANAVAAASPAVSSMAMATRIVERMPRLPYGLPSTFPFPAESGGTSLEASPAIQGIWAIACGRTSDERALWNSLAALLRNVALSSVSRSKEPDADIYGAFIGAVSRTIFGLHPAKDGLAFKPVVPAELDGDKHLRGVSWRNALLDITVTGTGSHIATFSIDGVSRQDYIVPDTLTGRHEVRIEMVTPPVDTKSATRQRKRSVLPVTMPKTMPASPDMEWPSTYHGVWHNPTDSGLAVMLNGVRLENASGTDLHLRPAGGYSEFLVMPVDETGAIAGHADMPHAVTPHGAALNFQAEWFSARALAREYYRAYLRRWQRLNKRGRATAADRPNRRLTQLVELTSDEEIIFSLEATDTTHCVLQIGYADGRDAGQRANALRTLTINGTPIASLPMPRTGLPADSTVTLLTHPVTIDLRRGINTLTLSSRPADIPPGRQRDTVMIDFLRITSLPPRP